MAFPEHEWTPSSHFDTVTAIGVYVHPSKDPKSDYLLGNLIELDMTTRGYDVRRLNEAGESAELSRLGAITTHPALVDSLRRHKVVDGLGALIIGNLHLDEVGRKLPTGRFFPYAIGGECKVSLISIPDGRVILSDSRTDTTEILKYDYPIVSLEPPRFLIERSLVDALEAVPGREGTKQARANLVIPLKLYVDNGYRAVFTRDWRERLNRRILYVNDIYTPQTGIYFEIKSVEPWESWFTESIDAELSKLRQSSEEGPWLNVGISLDQQLLLDPFKTRAVGVASFPLGMGIMTTMPTRGNLASWASIDEASILAHEIGHALGLPHTRDHKSLMFPTSSTMAMTLDSTNLLILSGLSRQFIRLSYEQRAARHLLILNAFFKSGSADRIEYIGAVYRDARSLWIIDSGKVLTDTTAFMDTASCRTYLTKYGIDPTLQTAVLGYTLYRLEDYDAARTYLERSLKDRGEITEAMELIYNVFIRQEKWSDARDVLRQIRDIDPSWLDYH